MSNDHDDDVIVISEDEARDETRDENADPDTHPVTEPVTMAGSSHGTGNGSGPAIPMPGASAAPETSATAEASEALVASATPAATPVTGDTAPDSSWPQLQSLFVDDPHAAVRRAADVAGGALAALVAAASSREQALRDSWQGDTTGTEELRTALRDYRDLAGRLSTVARDL